ncbi:hypothetical protein J3458_014419 [Metarhizium acridum]|uniref:uncharacterized protein n=1 Tax=Metarhizium acridum TaxID=92637 RepID=UPI001C6B1886|nr:hypothetical protein J3458_014419 [Metarhizium acridum]
MAKYIPESKIQNGLLEIIFCIDVNLYDHLPYFATPPHVEFPVPYSYSPQHGIAILLLQPPEQPVEIHPIQPRPRTLTRTRARALVNTHFHRLLFALEPLKELPGPPLQEAIIRSVKDQNRRFDLANQALKRVLFHDTQDIYLRHDAKNTLVI